MESQGNIRIYGREGLLLFQSMLKSFKRSIMRYLGSEEKCWGLWKARIKNNANVRRRIAEFLVRNEDLQKLIESGSIRNALERSLRTINVETVKSQRGKYGSRRVREILNSAGFVFVPYDEAKDVEKLEKQLKTQESSLEFSGQLIYTSEKLWKAENKRFDFILISDNRIQFVIEANYFTTAMSKVREVVKHFKELKKACEKKYRLIYITDGMGWIALTKLVKEMIEFEMSEYAEEKSSIPFLMNLELFRRNLDKIKAEMI